MQGKNVWRKMPVSGRQLRYAFPAQTCLARWKDEEGVAIGVRDNLDADLRIVVSSSHPKETLSFSVSEPTGSRCFGRSPYGGRVTRTPGLCEFMVRDALPGTYEAQAWSTEPMTVVVTIYRNWGRAGQSSETRTIHLRETGVRYVLAEVVPGSE